MTASNDAIREIVKALRRHIDAATLEKIVNELLDVPGNRSFRDAIEELARELDVALMSGVQHRSPVTTLPPVTMKSASRAPHSVQARLNVNADSGHSLL